MSIKECDEAAHTVDWIDSTDENYHSMQLTQSTSLGNGLTDDIGRGADDRSRRILARRVYICTGQLSDNPNESGLVF